MAPSKPHLPNVQDEDGARASDRTWQQTKSARTRTTILDAAIRCFHRDGYANTSTESIACEAQVSRGAMLHHFPNRFELIKATIRHLSQRRLDDFNASEAAAQQGAEHSRIEEGIDAYWELLQREEFVVFHELQVAARTAPELAEVLRPEIEAFELAGYERVKQLFPDLALSEAFQRANYLTKFLLEGMAVARATGNPNVPDNLMLGWLKRELRRSFQDVLTRVKRVDR